MEFPTTPWTVLAGATLHGDGIAAAALERFYVLYHRPVLAVVIARGMNVEASRDITQSFFVHLMENGTLRRAEREKGRFRSFLYGALRHFMADDFDRNTAAKRGGGAVVLPLNEHDSTAGPASDDETHQFDRAWALAIMERALADVQASLPPEVYAAVKAFLPGSQAPPTGASAAAAAGLSEEALRSRIHRVRLRIRSFIRHEISRTVSAPHEIDDEMAWLFQVLARG